MFNPAIARAAVQGVWSSRVPQHGEDSSETATSADLGSALRGRGKGAALQRVSGGPAPIQRCPMAGVGSMAARALDQELKRDAVGRRGGTGNTAAVPEDRIR